MTTPKFKMTTESDIEKILTQVAIVDLQAEKDNIMERFRLSEIRQLQLSDLEKEYVKNYRFKYFVNALAFPLPVIKEPLTIIHIGMDFAKQEAPLSKWQRFKNLFKRKRNK